MKGTLTILILLFFINADAQKVNEVILRGNESYRLQQYEKADKEYSEALQSDSNNVVAKYNKANTIYRLGQQDDAINKYDGLTGEQNDVVLRSKSFYNKGAILSRQKKLEESIEAYKSSLRLDPNDKEARENLQKALLELKKKQPPKPKEDQKKKQQNQPQPKMNKKEAEQRLKLLEQKEKEVQQRLQKEKSKTGGSQTKDW